MLNILLFKTGAWPLVVHYYWTVFQIILYYNNRVIAAAAAAVMYVLNILIFKTGPCAIIIFGQYFRSYYHAIHIILSCSQQRRWIMDGHIPISKKVEDLSRINR